MQEDDAVAATKQARTRVGDERPACPSPDFSKFLHAFSNRADVQRQFTKLPLEYGQVATAAIGTEGEYTRRTIQEFERYRNSTFRAAEQSFRTNDME
jgi:hypothetical protein